jgi:hypothetical protein
MGICDARHEPRGRARWAAELGEHGLDGRDPRDGSRPNSQPYAYAPMSRSSM